MTDPGPTISPGSVPTPDTGPNVTRKFVWRTLRSGIAIFLAHFASQFIALPTFQWTAPIILGLGAALREKYPGKYDWLPF